MQSVKCRQALGKIHLLNLHPKTFLVMEITTGLAIMNSVFGLKSLSFTFN